MKLTQRQQAIVIDEIYNQVSKPIIEANNKALESVKIKPDQYQKDREKYLKLQEQVKDLKDQIEALIDIYSNKDYNGYRLDYNPFYEGVYNNYIKHCKKQFVVLAEYPSKQAIEKDLILSGNKDIPELISTIVAKYKK